MAITGFEYEPWDEEQWKQSISMLKERWRLKEQFEDNSEKYDKRVRVIIEELIQHAPEVSESE